jgi:hypothetical protein
MQQDKDDKTMARKSKSTGLTVVGDSANLPVVPMANFKSFSKFVRLADELVDSNERIWKARERIRTKSDPFPTEQTFTLSDYIQSILAECRALWEEFNPERYYEGEDEDYGLREDLIAARLAYTLGSVKVTGGTPEAFSEMVLNHVADMEGLTWPALEGACRQVESECKFLSIAEIKEAINEHIELWDKRSNSIRNLDEYAKWGLEDLEQWKRNEQIREAGFVVSRARVGFDQAYRVWGTGVQQMITLQREAARIASQIEIGFGRLAGLEREVNEKHEALIEATNAKALLVHELECDRAESEVDPE